MHIDLCTMCVPGAKGSLMRVLDLLGLEWLSVWVLGIEPGPIGRTINALNCRAISPAPGYNSKFPDVCI